MENLYKTYTKLYNDNKKQKNLKGINDHMFFVTDLDTIGEFSNEAVNFTLEETEELHLHPERFMPKDNIMVVALHSEENNRNLPPACFCGHVAEDGEFMFSHYRMDSFDMNEETKRMFSQLAITYIFKRLNTKNTEIIYKETPFKSLSGKEKISPVVFIRNKKSETKYQYYLPSNPEWKHSWECVGHWRKLDGIGKDRHGEYNQLGRTWVNPCIKGDGELIKKIRILK